MAALHATQLRLFAELEAAPDSDHLLDELRQVGVRSRRCFRSFRTLVSFGVRRLSASVGVLFHDPCCVLKYCV